MLWGCHYHDHQRQRQPHQQHHQNVNLIKVKNRRRERGDSETYATPPIYSIRYVYISIYTMLSLSLIMLLEHNQRCLFTMLLVVNIFPAFSTISTFFIQFSMHVLENCELFFLLCANLLMRLRERERERGGIQCQLPLEVVQVLCNAQQCVQFGNR